MSESSREEGSAGEQGTEKVDSRVMQRARRFHRWFIMTMLVRWAIISAVWYAVTHIWTVWSGNLYIALGSLALYMVPTIYVLARVREAYFKDSRTGCFSVPYMELALERVEYLAKRGVRQFCLILVDVDGLKWLNTLLLWTGANIVIAEIARRMKKAKRPTDEDCRVGGDEFLIVLDGADIALGEKVARRIHAKVTGAAIKVRGREIVPGVTIAVVASSPGDCSTAALLERVEEVLMAAKKVPEGKGRNQVYVVNGVPATT
jgi:diguanylate cyclase (GGDEF)-like protein